MDLFVALKARGLTIVMVTHDHAVAAFADRMLTMRDGSLGGSTLATGIQSPNDVITGVAL